MKRASNGESTIHEDTAGRWHGYVSMGTKDGGLPDRRHVTGRTRAIVAKKVRDLQTKRDAGLALEAGKPPTLNEWMSYWLTSIAARRLRPRTLDSYQTMVRLHIGPVLGHHRLDRLQPEHLEGFYLALEQKGLSASTALRAHRILSRSLKVAHQRGKVGRNVAVLVDAPAAKRPVTPMPLDVSECRRLLETAKQGRNAARWTVAVALGLRQSEALGLMWRDVDLDRGTLVVRRGLHRVPGQGLVFEEPKTASSRRLIVLPKQLVTELRNHKGAQAAERARALDCWTDHDLVFPNELGGPMDDRNDYRAWVTLLRNAQVRRIRLHDGRHTAATLLLAEGIHSRVVMELLGHSAMRTTTDTYSHVMPALAQQAADRMEAALWGDREADAEHELSGSKALERTATRTATNTEQGPQALA